MSTRLSAQLLSRLRSALYSEVLLSPQFIGQRAWVLAVIDDNAFIDEEIERFYFALDGIGENSFCIVETRELLKQIPLQSLVCFNRGDPDPWSMFFSYDRSVSAHYLEDCLIFTEALDFLILRPGGKSLLSYAGPPNFVSQAIGRPVGADKLLQIGDADQEFIDLYQKILS